MMVDANNFYGWAMSQEISDGNFEWVSDDKCRNLEQLLSTQTAASPYLLLNYSIMNRMRRTQNVIFSR